MASTVGNTWRPAPDSEGRAVAGEDSAPDRPHHAQTLRPAAPVGPVSRQSPAGVPLGQRHLDGPLHTLSATTALRFLDSVSDAVIAVDRDWQFVYVNRQAEQLLGQAREQLLQHTCWEAAPFIFDKRHRRLANQAMTSAEGAEWEVHARPLKRWLQVRMQPAGDGQVFFLHDLTERELAMEQARDHALLLDEAWQVAGIGSWISDLTPGGRLHWSAQTCSIFGIAPEEFDGRSSTFLEFVHREDVAAVRAATSSAKRLKQPFDLKFRITRRDGEVRWLHSIARAAEIPEGRPARLIGIVHDITARETLEQHLQQSQRLDAIGQLAGGIAHDFNNLLTAVIGYADILSDELADDQELALYAAEISKAAQRGARLTRQMLAFGRRQIIAPRTLDLNVIVQDMMHMLRRIVPENVAFAINLAPDLGSIKADHSQIEEIVLNLVVNACQAMPDGGRLVIKTANTELLAGDPEFDSTDIAGPYVMLSVRDTGVGMDAATRARIFEPFFTTKERGCGTGLGLSTVYGIVKQSRGAIAVHSELGRGSLFRVALPRVADESMPPAVEDPSTHWPRGFETILVVEDDETVRAAAQQTLERCGYTVLTVGSAEEALDAARAGRAIDLVFCDTILPGLSGPRLAERLRLDRPGLRVLYTSGYSEDEQILRALMEPEAHFVAKPFSAAELASKVRQLLDAPRYGPASP